MSNTVKRRELRTLSMVEGNEKKYDVVIDGDRRKRWVGFGWVDEGPANDKDYARYPVVED